MHPTIEAYLAEQEKKQAEQKEQEKARFLLSLGLYEKEYAPGDETSYSHEQYPEWDVRSLKHYRRIPLEVTDAEYEALQKTQPSSVSNPPATNTVSTVFKVCAWILFIGAFIIGISEGISAGEVVSYIGYSSNVSNSFSIITALIWWLAGFVAGMLSLGFSEILRLLNEIKNK